MRLLDGYAVHAVSTHPPLRQRGEQLTTNPVLRWSLFQPTPRFVSEGNSVTQFNDISLLKFQPTPRFVSEGNN